MNRIFFPYWNQYIPKELWDNFETIGFHMTDLPYGRGGSPLQNLILRGHKYTFISAFKVNDTMDGGNIYLKTQLDLSGNAKDIYKRASDIICKEMIPQIILNNLKPEPQKGKIELFNRRIPTQSAMNNNIFINPKKVYDFIRMLDADGYPKAYFVKDGFRFEFTDASFGEDFIECRCRIYKGG